MLSQSSLESQKFVNLVSRKNLGLVVFTDVVSGCLDSSSAFQVDDNLSEALRELSADGVSTVFISGGNHERFSRFSDMSGFVSLANFGLSLWDKTGVHVLKQAQPYKEIMEELFDRLSLWLPISIGIKNLGVSLSLDYGGIPDHVKARNGLNRLLEEAECLDRFNVVNHGRIMHVLPPVSLKSAVLLAQLQERFHFEGLVLFGLNLLDDLLSFGSMEPRYSQPDISNQGIELMAFDPSLSILRTVTNAISDIRLSIKE